MGKSTSCAPFTKFQGPTKLATAIFIVTVCFYYFFIYNIEDASSEDHSLLLSSVQGTTHGNVMYSGMAMGKKQEVILQVKVIPVDLADESLNLLPKDSFSHACVIGKFIERLM